MQRNWFIKSTSDFQKHLTREDARNYLQYIENISLESSFDSLITNVKNVVVIKMKMSGKIAFVVVIYGIKI